MYDGGRDRAMMIELEEERIWGWNDGLTDRTRFIMTIWSRYIHEHGEGEDHSREGQMTYLERFEDQYNALIYRADCCKAVKDHYHRLWQKRFFDPPLERWRWVKHGLTLEDKEAMIQNQKVEAGKRAMISVKRWHEKVERWAVERGPPGPEGYLQGHWQV